jgi:hypothetical protein
MPYMLHDKESAPESGESFETARDAHEARAAHADKIVTFVCSDEERTAWHNREASRFATGEYVRVPWHDHARYCHPWGQLYTHFAHMSVKTPGMIAYTKNDEHGIADRQTTMKVGRYLAEFFGDVFSHDEITRYAGECSAAAMELHFTTDPDTIERVYIGGPQSCMSHAGSFDADRTCRHTSCRGGRCRVFTSHVHPTRAYGNSPDLALAYTGDPDHASARAIVWPANQTYSRTYGHTTLIETLLEANGYTRGDLEGARIRAIPDGTGYLMPYIDGRSTFAERQGKYLVLSEEGELETGITNGTAWEAEIYTCERCAGSYRYHENDGHLQYCPSCADDVYNCCECGEDFFDGAESVANGYLCESCADNARQTCVAPDCEEEWIEASLSRETRRDRRDRGVTAYCPDCARHHDRCTDCREIVHEDTCDADGRCEDCTPSDDCEADNAA